MWDSTNLIDFRKNINEDSAMNIFCKMCYQSSFANWKNSFYKTGLDFSPEWEAIEKTIEFAKAETDDDWTARIDRQIGEYYAD